MSKLTVTWAAIATLTFTTSAIADDITVDTALGQALVPQNPETLVVFDYLSLDTLDALGVEPDGIPAKLYVPYLDNLAETAKAIGSSSEPDFETIAKMDPDLIVIGGGSSKQMDPLSEIAPTIDMFVRGTDHVAQMKSRLGTFGLLTGTQDTAAELEAAFDAKLEAAKQAVAGKGKTLILLTNGGKISAYGANSRFGWLYTDVGLVEAVDGIDAATHGESVSFEFVADVNPDYIIAVDRSAAIGREAEAGATTLDNALVHGTKAGKTGNIFFLEPGASYVTGGGYQGMMSMLDSIIDGFSQGS